MEGIMQIKFSLFNFLKKRTRQAGVALLMVMSSISIMAFLLADLTYETQLNQMRVYNLQDKLQAQLNAEAGLNFALAKLKLYQEAYNILENNKNLREILKPSMLQNLITQPFMYPIPAMKNMSANQKNVLSDFEKNINMKGKLNVTMSPVSGFINPNNMRVERKTNNPNGNNPDDQDNQDNQNFSNNNNNDQDKKSPQDLIEDELVKLIQQSMDRKRETDEDFDDKYGNIDPNLLVKEIKFYVNRSEDFDDSERAEIEAQYLAKNIIPKHAPMTSIDEMYQLLGWPDAMVDLIKDRLTFHEVAIIPANEITAEQLRVIFPLIDEKQIEDFFRYRDGDPETQTEPKEFTNVEDFKNAIVNVLGLVNADEFDKRMLELEIAGLKVGTAGKLFKVESIGEYERASYRIVAYVDMPIKPPPPEKKKDNNNNNKDGNTGITDTTQDNEDKENEDENENENNNNNKNNNENDKEKKKKPTELMEPRVIEIRVN
jgi:hypothetical protein